MVFSHGVDETEAIPLIRPRGRLNPKLWAAVRKLMVCEKNGNATCTTIYSIPIKQAR